MMMSNNLLSDSLVDSVQIEWEETPHRTGPQVVNVPPELRVIRDYLSKPVSESNLKLIAEGVLDQHGRMMNDSGFWYPEDLDPDDEPFDGVRLSDPLDEIYLSRAAFDRLMVRFFRIILQNAPSSQKDLANSTWWPRFQAIVAQLEQRVA
jgi:hypothetical protein